MIFFLLKNLGQLKVIGFGRGSLREQRDPNLGGASAARCSSGDQYRANDLHSGVKNRRRQGEDHGPAREKTERVPERDKVEASKVSTGYVLAGFIHIKVAAV